MELEELQNAWQGLDQKLDRAIALQAELVRQAVVKTARRSSNRLAFWPAVDICLSIGTFVFCVAFLNAHWGQWPVMLPAGILAAGAVALLADSVRQLEIVLPLDWTGP